MKSELRVYKALDYLRSRDALSKLSSDCVTLGLNAPLVFKSRVHRKPKQNK